MEKVEYEELKFYEKNYFSREEEYTVRLHGFSELKDKVYLNVLTNGSYYLSVKKRKYFVDKSLLVYITEDRRILDPRLYMLLEKKKGFNKWVIWDEDSAAYYMTSHILPESENTDYDNPMKEEKTEEYPEVFESIAISSWSQLQDEKLPFGITRDCFRDCEEIMVPSCGFNLYAADNKPGEYEYDIEEYSIPIGKITMHLYDCGKIRECGFSVLEAADNISADDAVAIYELNNRYFKDGKYDISTSTFICYIDSISIEPEYSRKGIAKYLLENLQYLCRNFFSFDLEAAVTIAFPEAELSNNDEQAEEETMLSSLMSSAGFEQLETRNVFGKYYFEEL